MHKYDKKSAFFWKKIHNEAEKVKNPSNIDYFLFLNKQSYRKINEHKLQSG